MARTLYRLPRSFVFVSLFGALGWTVAACSEDSPSGAESSRADTPDADDGASRTEGDDDDDETDDTLPGDPPNAAAAINVKINGVERSFNGASTWTKFSVDGGVREGFQTNARSKNDWNLVLSVFSIAPGTYTCESGSLGGLSLLEERDDGSARTTFGDYVGTKKCTITLTEHGPRKGDHVKGTFSGELRLTTGTYPEKKLVFTDGTFDLVQIADTPSD